VLTLNQKSKSKRVKSRWQANQEQAKAGVPLGKTEHAWLDLLYANGSTKKPDEKAKAVGFRVNANRATVVRRISSTHSTDTAGMLSPGCSTRTHLSFPHGERLVCFKIWEVIKESIQSDVQQNCLGLFS